MKLNYQSEMRYKTIIGVKQIERLNDNIAAIGLSLAKEDIEILDKVSILPVEYPNWITAS